MSVVVTFGAQLLPLLAPVFALWLGLPNGARQRYGVLMVICGVIALMLVLGAGWVHQDPRPFVVGPTRQALVAHEADNGFPPDHTTVAATASLVVATVRRRLGALLFGSAVLGGLARVAANVHHVQDIVGGLLIAVVAVGVGIAVQRRLDHASKQHDAAAGVPSMQP